MRIARLSEPLRVMGLLDGAPNGRGVLPFYVARGQRAAA